MYGDKAAFALSSGGSSITTAPTTSDSLPPEMGESLPGVETEIGEGSAPEAPAREAVSVKGFLSDTVIFGAVGVFDRAIGFLLLPITTSWMTTREYGVLSMFTTTTEIMQYLVAMGILNSFFKHYAENTDERSKREILNASFWQITILASIMALLVIPWAGTWDKMIFGTGGVLLPLMIVPTTYFSVLISLGDCRLQADGKAFVYMFVNMFQTSTTRGLALLLLALGWGANGWIIGQSAGQVASIVAFSFLAFSGLSFRPDPVWLGRLFRFGLALVPLAISHWSMQGSARYMMNAMLDDPLHHIGLYTVGERISQIMAMLNLAFVLGWRRFAFSNLHHADGAKLLGHGASVFFVLSAFAATGLISLGDDLCRWMIRPDYWEGIRVIPYLTMAGFCWGVTEVIAISLYKSNKTYYLSGSYIVAAAICILLNFLLIRENGMIGAAQAWLCAEIAKLAMVFYFAQREFPIAIQFGRIAHALAIFIPTYLACSYFFANTTIASTFAQIGLVGMAPVILIATGFLEPTERDSIRAMIARVRGR
ncbi:oligosaccharide flippase family protein [bacterium]|nr:oligosaccharide flippase family protein [bacterium]